MRKYESLGQMTEIDANASAANDIIYYIPHFVVLKSSSLKTKLRLVFDAFARVPPHISLNDTLMVGTTIQNDLFVILLRFRKHEVAFIADIFKMYRQFMVNSQHRDYGARKPSRSH